MTGSRITYAPGGGPDKRCYRVSCEKIARALPSFKPQWTVRRGVEEVYAALVRHAVSAEEFTSSRFIRLRRVKELQDEGQLDETLRRTAGDAVLQP